MSFRTVSNVFRDRTPPFPAKSPPFPLLAQLNQKTVRSSPYEQVLCPLQAKDIAHFKAFNVRRPSIHRLLYCPLHRFSHRLFIAYCIAYCIAFHIAHCIAFRIAHYIAYYIPFRIAHYIAHYIASSIEFN